MTRLPYYIDADTREILHVDGDTEVPPEELLEVIGKLAAERDEAERLLRLSYAELRGHDVGDKSLEFLRRRHSPELADISIAMGMAVEELRRG